MATRPTGRPATRGRAAAPSIFDPVPSDADPESGRLGNVPEVSVSELSGALKRTVEERFGYVRVRGEVSNYRGPHSSGHAYFSLKDEGARIDAVVWRTSLGRMRVKPEEGMEVVATGKITTFPGKSSYQIVIETLEPAGVGALMAMVEERRRRFAAEGLFDAERKRGLPFLPGIIGVVTSPTGAVIRDILHRIEGRFPRHVLLWPVRVQGEGSADEVARAIWGFNALAAGTLRPDVIIVARGGGSLEDLWGFNDEAVIRAAAGSLIPLISAIGHETDWTLLDHVADLRAPTPTGAAELCVPVRADLAVAIDSLEGRHGVAMLRGLDRARDALRATARALPSGAELLAVPQQRLDRAATLLPSSLRAGVDARRLALARLGSRLAAQSPSARLGRAVERLQGLEARLQRSSMVAAERRRQRLETVAARLNAALKARATLAMQENRNTRHRLVGLADRLRGAVTAAQERRSARLTSFAQLLSSLGYRAVLARGYALVRDEGGRPVRTADGIAPGARLGVELVDGIVTMEALDDGETSRAPRSRPAKQAGKAPAQTTARQGTLF